MPITARPIAGRLLNSVRCAAAAILSLASACTHAGDFSAGAGAGVVRGKSDCVDAYACDRSSTQAKLFLGYRVADGIELQAVYFDGGKFDGGDISKLGTAFGGRFKVDGLGFAAGYRWSFAPGWSLKGQLGVASVRTHFDYAAPFAGEASKTTTQPLAGLSLGFAVTPNWQVSLDYDETRFKVHTTRGSLRMLGVAAQYTF
jgi:hypothetical protein